jgi:hypothetical protein
MYIGMFYIQWHHLAKNDLWNRVYMNVNMNIPLIYINNMSNLEIKLRS